MSRAARLYPPPPLAKQLCFELCTWLDASGTPLFANWLYAARSLFSATKKGRLKRVYNCSQVKTFTLHQEDQHIATLIILGFRKMMVVVL